MATFNIEDFVRSHKPHNTRFFTVAIDGRDASGKSALARYLSTLLPDFTVLNGDDYFEPVEGKVVWGEFNDKRFIADVIEPINTSNKFTYRPYDWHKQPPVTEKVIKINKGIIIERCLSFSFNVDWDLKIWVDTPREECLRRGIERDSMPKNRSTEAWIIWMSERDEYMARFDPITKADLVIYGTKPFQEQIA